MNSLIDQNFIIADDTIIAYCGKDKNIKLPSSYQGNNVRKIGSGAFYGDESVESIFIPEGIEEIGDKAFVDMPNLNEIHIPASFRLGNENSFLYTEDYRKERNQKMFEINHHTAHTKTIYLKRIFSKSQLQDIQAASILCPDGFYLLTKPLYEVEGLRQIYDVFGSYAKPAARIDIEMERIIKNIEKPVRPCFSFYSQQAGMSEEVYILSRIKRGLKDVYSLDSEKERDRHIRTNQENNIPKVGVMRLVSNRIQEIPGTNQFMVPFEYHIGQFYWISVRKIVYQGNTYYLYHKEFLNGDVKCPFVSWNHDVTVYNEKGRIKDTDLENKIYGKYKLLSML